MLPLPYSDSKSRGTTFSGRPGTRASSRYSYYSAGIEFYDTGYSEREDDPIIEQLDLGDLKIASRQKELQLLQSIYDHVQGNKREGGSKSSVAFIRGVSGTGKSTLVKQFLEDLADRSSVCSSSSTGPPALKRPFFLTGKYDELSGGDPFSAIVEAFSGFAISLQEEDPSLGEMDRIRKAVQASLGSEANYLTTVIPDLKGVIGEQLPVVLGSKQNAWNRLKYLFQVFSNAISSRERPVILFLDDLQWCDRSSLDLIQALLTDSDLKHFMFVGAYRSDEVHVGHGLHDVISEISRTRSIETMELRNLQCLELAEFIASTLKLEDNVKRAMTLAKPIYKKTKGNIFFAIQILEELQRKQILSFSRVTFEWDWDIENIDLNALLSDDVVAAVTDKIRNSPSLVQKALIIMAYSRSTLEINTLQKLMIMGHWESTQERLQKALDQAVVDGLLSNSMGSSSYSFAHDRIQQAAYSMLPAGQKQLDFRTAMGMRLFKLGKSEFGEDWMLFAAADHLNAAADHNDQEDKDFLRELNLMVGERAASVTAYDTAAKFLSYAMQSVLATENPWESSYGLTLHIYQQVADVKLCQGEIECGKSLGETVLERARSKEDMLPTQLALSKALGREERHGDSFLMSRQALRSMKEYPRCVVRIHVGLIRDLIYVKRWWKKHTDVDVLRLPLLTDKKKEVVMELLSTTAYQAYYCGNMVEFLVSTLRMLRITFKHGLCGQSGVAIIGYCLFCNNMNDMGMASRCAQLAMDVLEKTRAKELECLQVFVVAHWLNAWKQPHQAVVSLYERAFKAGMESGDHENALLSRTACYHHQYVAGYPLEAIDLKYERLMDKLDIYKMESVQVMSVEQWLPIKILRDRMEIDYNELLKFGPTKNDGSEKFQLNYGYLARLQIGLLYGNLEFARTILQKLERVPDFDKSHSTNCLGTMFPSLVYSSLAMKTRKRAFLKLARKHLIKLRALCKNKGRNSWHRCMLMEAHFSASGGKKETSVQASYDHAIGAAIKSGHKQDAALAAQLAGEYFLSMREDMCLSTAMVNARDSLIQQYFRQARDLYSEWGAIGLVKHLETKYGYLLGGCPKREERTSTMPSDFSVDENSLASLDRAMGILPPKNITQDHISTSHTQDEVSLMSDHSSWREGREAYFANPHTMDGRYTASHS